MASAGRAAGTFADTSKLKPRPAPPRKLPSCETNNATPIIPHAAKNEAGLNVWKLWVIKEFSFSR
jgi:hypothetical protein